MGAVLSNIKSRKKRSKMYSDSDDDFSTFGGGEEYIIRDYSPSCPPLEVDRVPLAVGPLPQVCFAHKTGCTRSGCRRLHICHFFLAGICNFGDETCRRGHTLTDLHNAAVCRAWGLDPRQEGTIARLAQHAEERKLIPERTFHRHLEVCFRYRGRIGSCQEGVCNRLHICRSFVAGNCGIPAGMCTLSHDLHTMHNNSVLSRHRATALRDDELLLLLKEKLRGADRAAAAGQTTGRDHDRSRCSDRQARPRGKAGNQRRKSKDNLKRASASPPAPKDPFESCGLTEQLQCAICLGLLDKPCTLGCGHSYCGECIEQVRQQMAAKCPECRADILTCTRSVALEKVLSSMATLQVGKQG